jgi:hypothetical protein
MYEINSRTFLERLRSQIEEEERKYRNALESNMHFLELKKIKTNIKKLQSTLVNMMKNLRGQY